MVLQELEDLRRKYLTKKGPVQKVMGQMRLLSNEDKVLAFSGQIVQIESLLVSYGD